MEMPRARVAKDVAVRFGAIVSRLRKERGWTLGELAGRTGMHATYLGVLERGLNMPTLATILQFAAVFGIAAADLVREVEQLRNVDAQPVRESMDAVIG